MLIFHAALGRRGVSISNYRRTPRTKTESAESASLVSRHCGYVCQQGANVSNHSIAVERARFFAGLALAKDFKLALEFFAGAFGTLGAPPARNNTLKAVMAARIRL